MPRLVRHAVPAVSPVLLALAMIAFGPGSSVGASVEAIAPAVVDWPPLTGLLVGEVVTGGASASDEFVELYNAGSTSVDLAGLEVAYVTSTGGTITRKAIWASTTLLDPGRHLLLANSAGIHAVGADAVYTGGLAATGGAIIVRPVGGAAIDAIGWGDATNAFVEGTAAPAPTAGSSIERRPGGAGGNAIDTNANQADWLVNPAPAPQNLLSPAVPSGPLPTGTPGPPSSPTPTAAPTVSPSPTATATPTAQPTVTPEATGTPEPTVAPTPNPEPTSTPEPSPTGTPEPTPEPSPTLDPTAGTIDIAAARAQVAESRIRVHGIVTVEPGRIVDDRTIAIQDSSGGILVRLDGGRKDLALPRGTDVVVEGRLTARYGALEIRLDGDDPLEILGDGALPAVQLVQLAELAEATEARLVQSSGIVVDVDRAASGTTTIIIEDASGRGRVVAFGGAGTLPEGIRREATLVVTGIGGQRASARGRLDGYRIWIRDDLDIHVSVPAPSGSPAPSASPSASPPIVSIALARARRGQKVTVEATVTSQAGLLDGDGRRVTIQDGTGAILLRLVARGGAPPVGSRVRVAGSVGTYFGAPQLAATGAVLRLGAAKATPLRLSRSPRAGEEWRLVRVRGTVIDVKRSGEAWRAELRLADGSRVPIVGLTSAGIPVGRIIEGRAGAIVGIVRRAHPSATDRRFAVLPRSRADVDLSAEAAVAAQGDGAGPSADSSTGSGAVGGSSSAAASPSGADEGVPVVVVAAELPANPGRFVRLGGLVVSVASATGSGVGPAVVIDDASGMATLRLPVEAATLASGLRPGDLIEATGEVVADGAGWVVVVGDPAAIVVAGQVGDHSDAPASGSPSTDDLVEPSDTSGAATWSAETVQPDPASGASHPDDATVTPLVSAVGAGALLAIVAAAGAAGSRWRRRQAEHRESKEATERLVELLAEAQGDPTAA